MNLDGITLCVRKNAVAHLGMVVLCERTYYARLVAILSFSVPARELKAALTTPVLELVAAITSLATFGSLYAHTAAPKPWMHVRADAWATVSTLTADAA